MHHCVRSQAYNAPMSTSTREYMEAIDHLPEGATLVLQEFSWENYERLVEDLTVSHARLRVTYDHGRVEKELIWRLIHRPTSWLRSISRPNLSPNSTFMPRSRSTKSGYTMARRSNCTS